MVEAARALPTALFSLLLLCLPQVNAAPYDFPQTHRKPSVDETDRLPFEICGLVGGYVLTVLLWGVLLLTVGRRMRRKALDPPKELELEMKDKPMRPTVKTPGSPATRWLKKFRNNDSGVGSSPQSPVVQSPTSFDQRVIDADRERAQEEMERLYAAVMDHDRKKHSPNVSISETNTHAHTPERRRPSAINITRPAEADEPSSPMIPIYPPDYPLPLSAPMPPTRLRDTQSHFQSQPQPPPQAPPSILSKRNQPPPTTTKSTRFNLKNLRISGPVEKYPGAAPDDEARTPLSPRFQTAPSPAQTASPTTPYSPSESLDTVHPLPAAAPHRGAPRIAVSATHPLPLRSYAEPLQSPGIQTTVLDRRVDKLSLGTPKTGVPYTPYSPYMPFTPVTPVTPHLVTKKERKERVKERRGVRAGKTEEVKSEREMWGDAY